MLILNEFKYEIISHGETDNSVHLIDIIQLWYQFMNENDSLPKEHRFKLQYIEYLVRLHKSSNVATRLRGSVQNVFDYCFYINHYVDQRLMKDLSIEEVTRLQLSIEEANSEHYSYAFPIFLCSYNNKALIPKITKVGLPPKVITNTLNGMFKDLNIIGSVKLIPQFKNKDIDLMKREIKEKIEAKRISKLEVTYLEGKHPILREYDDEGSGMNTMFSFLERKHLSKEFIQEYSPSKNADLFLAFLGTLLDTDEDELVDTFSRVRLKLKSNEKWSFNKNNELDLIQDALRKKHVLEELDGNSSDEMILDELIERRLN